jgi:hypothetical protein
VALEITPTPTSEERAAIEQALASIVDSRGAQGRAEWWQAGVRENVLDEDVPNPES